MICGLLITTICRSQAFFWEIFPFQATGFKQNLTEPEDFFSGDGFIKT